MSKIDPATVAICTVHGNSAGYEGDFAIAHPWPALQMDMVERHTPAGYRVYAYGNRLMREQSRIFKRRAEVEFIDSRGVRHGVWDHVWPIRNWLARRAIADGYDYIVHLDSDAFPTADDWLDRYVGAIDETCPVVAVQRKENGDTHSDRCFLVYSAEGFRRWAFDFSVVGVVDAGGAISETLEQAGVHWWPLNRTNVVNYHPVIAALYDDRIYHHGAGSRSPAFRVTVEQFDADADFAAAETALHRELMGRLFADPDRFLAELRGLVPPVPPTKDNQ